MRYFNENLTVEELDAQYKKLAFQLHPDRGGDTAEFQKMKGEYEERKAQILQELQEDEKLDEWVGISSIVASVVQKKNPEAYNKVAKASHLFSELMDLFPNNNKTLGNINKVIKRLEL